jgi:thiol-disulfide isomerase/thioredoxin
VRRAAAVVLAAVALAGCGRGKSEPPVTVSRFDAVKAGAPATDGARWCDAFYASGGPRLDLPALASARPGDVVPALAVGRPVWVNVWATWCVPCRREMPLLLRWRDRMHKDGIEVEMVFLSVDAKAADLTAFLQANPEVAPSPSARLLAPDGLDPWLARFVSPVPAGIPVQVLAGADGAVRCVKSGSLRDGDYPLVASLLR